MISRDSGFRQNRETVSVRQRRRPNRAYYSLSRSRLRDLYRAYVEVDQDTFEGRTESGSRPNDGGGSRHR